MKDQTNSFASRSCKSEPSPLDLEYWQKIRLGNTTAFSTLFKKYYEPLYQFAGRFVKDAQAAENIVQNAFVDLWTHREHLHIKSNLKSYLYTMVKNHSLNYLKKEKSFVSIDERPCFQENLDSSPEENVIKREWHTAVHQAIDKLPEQCRLIYLMKRYDNLKYTEIAEMLNISVNTVKTQMKRALKSLLKQLSSL